MNSYQRSEEHVLSWLCVHYRRGADSYQWSEEYVYVRAKNPGTALMAAALIELETQAYCPGNSSQSRHVQVYIYLEWVSSSSGGQ